MTFLYNRTASIVIREKDNNDQRDISGLRVVFEIEKSIDSSSNTAVISVYNMNKSKRKFSERSDLEIILSTGYTGFGDPKEKILFQGDIQKVTSRKDGPDIVTTYEIGDNQDSLSFKFLDKSYQKGVKIKSIIKDLAKSLDIILNDVNLDKLSNASFLTGFVADGLAKDTLDKLFKKEGLEWSVQENELIITDQKDINENAAVKISSKTGMLNKPIPREDEGFEILTLIDPAIKPQGTIDINEGDFKGSFFVRKCSYRGDTHGDEWTLLAVCV